MLYQKISIARPLPEKKLNITWKTFRDRLTPGQKEKWTLHVTTPDGKPAKAQLMSVLMISRSTNWQNIPGKCHWDSASGCQIAIGRAI